MSYIFFFIYLIASWKALDKVWYSKKVYIVNNTARFYTQKMCFAVLLGWLAIPIAIIQLLLNK